MQNTTELRETLTELLYDHGQDEGTQIDVSSYEEGGVLTTDEGFTVRVEGSEYQVTIVRSR